METEDSAGSGSFFISSSFSSSFTFSSTSAFSSSRSEGFELVSDYSDSTDSFSLSEVEAAGSGFFSSFSSFFSSSFGLVSNSLISGLISGLISEFVSSFFCASWWWWCFYWAFFFPLVSCLAAAARAFSLCFGSLKRLGITILAGEIILRSCSCDMNVTGNSWPCSASF